MALRELRITNMAVFTDAVLEFTAGFVVLTGETGAGKSVCVAALRAALGGRGDADSVRAGAPAGRVAAVFDDVPDEVRSRLAELGARDDEDVLTLVRELPRIGRGTCRVNGALVSIAALRDIGDRLVEVTSQGASQRLLRPSWQRELLDAFAGERATNARKCVEHAVRAWRDAGTRRDAARAAARTGQAELARAQDTVADLVPIALRSGEEEVLAAERLRLRHAAGIAGAADALARAAGGEETGAADALAGGVATASPIAGMDPTLRALADRAVDLVDQLRDLALEGRRHADSTLIDEARLGEVEERLHLLGRIRQRYGSIDEALEELDRARGVVAAAEGGDEGEALEAAVEAAAREAAEAAACLSEIRAEAARGMERRVEEVLHRLALPHARLRIVLSRQADPVGVVVSGEPLRCGLHGIDDVVFRLAANRDVMPMPLDEGASGGELSRLALAVSAVVDVKDGPALVLDEVDTGIGGETAATVGDVLATIGASRQVVAVTHRPEIAARASGHLVVSKRQAAGGPQATVEATAGHDRVVEIARLMSGRSTAAALARAGELLKEGREQDRAPRSRVESAR